jgi:hypothetical protein
MFESFHSLKTAEEVSEGMITKATVDNAKVRNCELGIFLLWISVQNHGIKSRRREYSILSIELATSHQMSSEVCDGLEGKVW